MPVETVGIEALSFRLRLHHALLPGTWLVANDEQTHQYTESPLRRVARRFEFSALTKPGVYVIDFIGNGVSSRAVVRKGRLQYLARTSTAGHVFTLFDDQNRQAPDATLWLAGHEYLPDEQGRIVVPFTTSPGQQNVVLSRGDFSSLKTFAHESENYQLVAGIYVDRESLLRNNQYRTPYFRFKMIVELDPNRPPLCANDQSYKDQAYFTFEVLDQEFVVYEEIENFDPRIGNVTSFLPGCTVQVADLGDLVNLWGMEGTAYKIRVNGKIQTQIVLEGFGSTHEPTYFISCPGIGGYYCPPEEVDYPVNYGMSFYAEDPSTYVSYGGNGFRYEILNLNPQPSISK